MSSLNKNASYFGSMLAMRPGAEKTVWLNFVHVASAIALGHDYDFKNLMAEDASPFKENLAQYAVHFYEKTQKKEWLEWAFKNDFMKSSVPNFSAPLLFFSTQHGCEISLLAREKNLFAASLDTSLNAPDDIKTYSLFVSDMMNNHFFGSTSFTPTAQFGDLPSPIVSLLRCWPKAICNRLIHGEWDKKNLDIACALGVANNIVIPSDISFLCKNNQSLEFLYFKDLQRSLSCKSPAALKLCLILSKGDDENTNFEELKKIIGPITPKDIDTASGFLCTEGKISANATDFFNEIIKDADESFRQNTFLHIVKFAPIIAANLADKSSFKGLFENDPSQLIQTIDEVYKIKNSTDAVDFWDYYMPRVSSVLGDLLTKKVVDYIALHMPPLKNLIKTSKNNKIDAQKKDIFLEVFSLNNALSHENQPKSKLKI